MRSTVQNNAYMIECVPGRLIQMTTETALAGAITCHPSGKCMAQPLSEFHLRTPSKTSGVCSMLNEPFFVMYLAVIVTIDVFNQAIGQADSAGRTHTIQLAPH